MEEKWTWLGPAIVVLFLLLYAVSAGIVFCFNALVIYIQDDFHQPLTLLEWLGALPASIPMLAAPLAMVLNYKIGTWGTVLVGTILTTIGLCCSGLAQTIGILFFTYGTVATIGITLIINPPQFLIDQIYPYNHPRHVLATSITACGYPLAALIMVPTADQLAANIGWKLTYVVLGIVIMIIGIPSVALARLWEKYNDQKDITGEASEHEEHKISIPTKRRLLMSVLWFLASLTKCFAYYTPMLTLIKHMDSLGIARGMSWKVIPVMGASELVSRLMASYFGDKMKGKTLYMYLSCCFILGVINLFGPLFTNYLHFMIYGAGLGLFGGPIIAALYSCSAEILGGQEVPLLFSIFRSGMGIATMTGPVISGAVFDMLGTFQPMFFSYATTYFLTALIYAVIIAINQWHPIAKPQDRANLLNSLSSSLTYQTLSNEENIVNNQK